MGRLLHPVILRQEITGSGQDLSVVFLGTQRGKTQQQAQSSGYGCRQPVLAVLDDPLPGDEHIIKPHEAFASHLAVTHRVFEPAARHPPGAHDQLDPGGTRRYYTRHGVVGLIGLHPLGGHHHQLVHEGGAADMGLHAPNDDTVVPFLHLAHVQVRVLLLTGMARPVPLRVRHCDGHYQVFFPEAPVHTIYVLPVLGVGLLQLWPHHVQGEDGVAQGQGGTVSQLLSQLQGFSPIQQVLGPPGRDEKQIDQLLGFGVSGGEYLPELRIVKPFVLSGVCLGSLAGYRVGGHVGDLLTIGVDYPTVSNAFQVVLGGLEGLGHGASSCQAWWGPFPLSKAWLYA